jgi:hypothetical protein
VNPKSSDPVTALWAGVVGPPLTWAIRIGAGYLLVPHACRAESLWLLHGLTLAALASCAAFAALAWRLRLRVDPDDGVPDDSSEPRVGFMARLGLLSSALFGAVIVAEGLANLFVDPCHAAGPLLP